MSGGAETRLKSRPLGRYRYLRRTHPPPERCSVPEGRCLPSGRTFSGGSRTGRGGMGGRLIGYSLRYGGVELAEGVAIRSSNPHPPCPMRTFRPTPCLSLQAWGMMAASGAKRPFRPSSGHAWADQAREGGWGPKSSEGHMGGGDVGSCAGRGRLGPGLGVGRYPRTPALLELFGGWYDLTRVPGVGFHLWQQQQQPPGARGNQQPAGLNTVLRVRRPGQDPSLCFRGPCIRSDHPTHGLWALTLSQALAGGRFAARDVPHWALGVFNGPRVRQKQSKMTKRGAQTPCGHCLPGPARLL